MQSLFQSSPFPKEGRYATAYPIASLVSVFQSSPFPKEGRYLAPQLTDRFEERVSILALPEGRALPLRAVPAMANPAFQSSPFPKEGRYVDEVTFPAYNLRVSILALPEGRALQEAIRFGQS